MYSLPYVVRMLMYVAYKLWVEKINGYLDYFPLAVMVMMNIMPMLCMMYCCVGGVAASDDDDNETLLTKAVQNCSIHRLVSLDHQLWAVVSHGASLMEEVRTRL